MGERPSNVMRYLRAQLRENFVRIHLMHTNMKRYYCTGRMEKASSFARGRENFFDWNGLAPNMVHMRHKQPGVDILIKHVPLCESRVSEYFL